MVSRLWVAVVGLTNATCPYRTLTIPVLTGIHRGTEGLQANTQRDLLKGTVRSKTPTRQHQETPLDSQTHGISLTRDQDRRRRAQQRTTRDTDDPGEILSLAAGSQHSSSSELNQ